MSDMSVADIAAVTNRDHYNDGMFASEWFWIIIILFLFGNNGWGNRGYGQETLMSEEFIKRDIFNTNQNVSNTACETQKEVLESRYTTQLGLQQVQASQQACCCETNRNIDSVRYDGLLNAKDAQMQLAECCCDLKTAIHAEGEATRNMIQADKIEQLRDQVFATNQALNNANLATQIINSIIPRPAPAYPSCSPFVPSNFGYNGCGCGC